MFGLKYTATIGFDGGQEEGFIFPDHESLTNFRDSCYNLMNAIPKEHDHTIWNLTSDEAGMQYSIDISKIAFVKYKGL